MRRTAVSPREQQVIHLIAEGFTNARIANELGISGHTVKHIVTSAMIKFDAANRAQLIARAAYKSLLGLDVPGAGPNGPAQTG